MSQQQRRQPKKPKKSKPNRDCVGTPSLLPPDFSKQCHFTQRNFTCKHHTWVTDPKITHVSPCKCKHHKNLCDNMAKSTKEVWFDKVCSSCSEDASGDSSIGLGLDPRLNMAEAVKKRIFELEQQKKIIVDSLPSKKGTNTSTTTAVSSKPPLQQEKQTRESDWGIDEATPAQPPPKSIKEVEKIPKSTTEQAPKPTMEDQPTVLNPESTKAPQALSSKNKKSEIFFEDDDSSSEEERLYQLGKERDNWLSVPEVENGNGVADKSTGIFRTLYNVVTWKSKPKFVLKEIKLDEPPKEIVKVDSDEEPWEDHGEWVHVVENVEDN